MIITITMASGKVAYWELCGPLPRVNELKAFLEKQYPKANIKIELY